MMKSLCEKRIKYILKNISRRIYKLYIYYTIEYLTKKYILRTFQYLSFKYFFKHCYIFLNKILNIINIIG